MKRKLTFLVASCAFVIGGGVALAHHSFAMFDSENPVTLSGKVTEFKFTSPHAFILLEVKGPDGASVVWNLEKVAAQAHSSATVGVRKPSSQATSWI